MQLKLFADPRPLTERLGPEFFRSLPREPGVYLMRDAEGTVIYVGKARNLRTRLASYQLANPDRMARRTLRLVRTAVSIEWILCDSESSALAREAELLMELKPRFNRAGVWEKEPRHFLWRIDEDCRVQFEVSTDCFEGWNLAPNIRRIPFLARAALHRIVWRLTLDQPCSANFPLGWQENIIPQFHRTGPCNRQQEDIASLVQAMNQLASGDPLPLREWLTVRLPGPSGAFAKNCLELDLEILDECTRTPAGPGQSSKDATKSGRADGLKNG